MADSEEKKQGAATRYWQEFKTALWNPEKKEVFGRTGINWVKLLIFYICFYSGLALFFSAMIAAFYATVDQNRPKLQGMSSRLKGSPSLGFRPMPDAETTLIAFRAQDFATFDMYVNNLQSYLMHYEKQNIEDGENLQKCTAGGDTAKDGSACTYDFEKAIAGNCDKSKFFGYRDGMPCVMLKLNKVFAWEPEPLDADDGFSQLGNRSDANYVGVRCYGENPADQENLGEVTFYPPEGWPIEYYPYLNQKGYRAPLVFAQFRNLKPGVVIFVECRAYAKNIHYDKERRLGMVHFEILVDS